MGVDQRQIITIACDRRTQHLYDSAICTLSGRKYINTRRCSIFSHLYNAGNIII